MRAAALALCLVAGCGGGKSDLDVSVSATNPIDGITQLVVTVTDASGRVSQPVTLQVAGGKPVQIPPERSFSLTFDSSISGTIVVDVEASDPTGNSLGEGKVMTSVTPGQVSSAAVILKGGHPMTDGGLPDSSTAPDLTMPPTMDASSGDLTIPPDLGLPGNYLLSAAANFPTDKGPVGIVRNDINGDGNLDLVVACNTANTVDILFGKGDGTFMAPKSVGVGQGPIFVLSFDFSNDGKPDVVSVNNGSNNLTLLTGDGAGNFGQPATLAVGTTPVAAALADFNNDNKLDLAVISSTGLQILLNNAMGSFKPPTNFAAAQALSVDAFDYDRNGKPDIVIGCANGNVLLYAGDGAGGFAPVNNNNLNAGNTLHGVVGAEFNGDTHPDLVAAVAPANMGQVGFLAGDGTGNFAAAVLTPVDGTPFHIRAADITGDNKVDVFTTNHGTDDLSLLLGKGDGTFQPVQNYPVGKTPAGVAFGDLNGDGRIDLATANFGSDNVSVLLQK
jgi:hypothetical protein